MHSFTSISRVMCTRPRIVRLGLTLAAGVLLSHCTSSPKSEVVVSVKDQRMGLYEKGVLKKQYVVSTSKFGLGDRPNSYCTPIGKHEVIAKIGHGLPPGAVLKSRHWNGEVLKPNAPGRDPIVSRILWLRGLESNNRNAMRRFIYIHGTTEENRLGRPASYGCIRMGMKDVVNVFNDVGIGAKVVITKDHLPGGKKEEEAKPEPEVPASAAPQSVTTPAEKPTLATAAKISEKNESSLSSATPVPVEITQADKPSQRSFLPWSRGDKSKGIKAATADTIPEAKDKVSVTQKKPGTKSTNQHQIGPSVPESIAKGKAKKDKVEKVSSTTSRLSIPKSYITHG